MLCRLAPASQDSGYPLLYEKKEADGALQRGRGSFRGAIPVHEDISASGRVLRKTAKVGVKLEIWSAADFSSEEGIALHGGPCPRKKPQPHPGGASAVLTSEEKKANASL